MSVICQRCNKPNADEAKFCLHCGAMIEQATAEGADPLIGKILVGRYRIVSVIGEGGMGKVYLAEQKMGTATRKVAIKTLHPELSNDPQLVARFHRESETVIELSHPNTIQFFDFGELDDRTLFIVMEFIEGEDLAHALQRGPIDPARADKLLIQICGSLHEAHQRGVVHRDLKPENVLLTDRGGQTDFVKVLDFGIAKRSEAEDESHAKLTKQGMVLGTPPYMSPEQFSGQALDPRSDIYSLGVMAYEMLTGRLPFEAKTPWEWATKHLTAQPTPIEAHPHARGLPEQKKQAIARALQKSRDDRQATVLEFLQQFTGYQDAQAAWTMATSAGGLMPRTPNPNATPRTPIGTPGPMPQSYQTPTPHPSQQNAWTSYPSGQMEEETVGSSGAGKILAVLVFLVFILGGGAAGGIYWWTQQNDRPIVRPVQPQPQPVQPIGTANPPVVTDARMVPTTPDTQQQDQQQQQQDQQQQQQDQQQQQEPDEPEEQQAEEEEEEQPTKGGPSAGDLARARSLIASGSRALDGNDIEAAIGALSQAQRAVGRNHAVVRSLRAQLSRKGSNKVGILMQQGNCREAQALFRRLRSVGASGPSTVHFSGDWCPRP